MITILWLRRVVSWVLIAIAIWLFWPIPGPDDLVNFTLGGYFSNWFGISLAQGILLTYTVLPVAILWLGAYISPKPTESAFWGIINKIKRVCIRIINNKYLLVGVIAMIVILYYVYILYIADMLGVT